MQSYLCVSLNATSLDAVALVLRGNGLVVYASDIADAALELPNVDALIKNDMQGDCPEMIMHASIVGGRGPIVGRLPPEQALPWGSEAAHARG
jgi:hypothetical protein